jgi:hypothetical protein
MARTMATRHARKEFATSSMRFGKVDNRAETTQSPCGLVYCWIGVFVQTPDWHTHIAEILTEMSKSAIMIRMLHERVGLLCASDNQWGLLLSLQLNTTLRSRYFERHDHKGMRCCSKCPLTDVYRCAGQIWPFLILSCLCTHAAAGLRARGDYNYMCQRFLIDVQYD